MTAEGAGVSERERLARELYRRIYPGNVNTPDSKRTDESDAAEFDRAYATWDAGDEGWAPGTRCREIADALLAAGFGDVSGVKAAVVESAVEAARISLMRAGWPPASGSILDAIRGSVEGSGAEPNGSVECYSSGNGWVDCPVPSACPNVKREVTDTSWSDPNRDERRRPGCHCFMWDEDCPEHPKNGASE